MKRLSHKKKNYLIKHALNSHIHDLIRKEKKNRLRSDNLYFKIRRRRSEKFVRDPKSVKHEVYKADSIFSLKENPSEVINFLNQVEKTLDKSIPVKFDLSEIVSMGPETLTYFCALIKDEKFNHGTAIIGDSPKDPELKQMILRSGFYDTVSSYITSESPHKDSNNVLINSVSEQKVKSELAAKVSQSAILHTFNTDNPDKELIRIRNSIVIILIECMANTKNHANFDDPNEVYNWWIFAYKEPETQITKFCFLDIGVGIFESLEKKNTKGLLPDFIKNRFIPNQSDKTLSKIFNKERKSSTGQKGRGLGLFTIYDHVKKNKFIRGFTLLSNDIIAKIEYNKPDDIKISETELNGTIYFWDLIPSYEE
jgi:hypothetical protein